MRNSFRVGARLAAVFALSFAVLGYGITHSGIASAFSDPVSHVRAQDEAVYAHISLRTAIHGGWLTPNIMGRFLLQKPPLFLWLASLSVKLFGPTLWALRLPSLLAAALATVLIFWWVSELWPVACGWTAVWLLLGNPVWHIFARLGYMDMLFVLWMAAAVYVVQRDPGLREPRGRIAFAAFSAAAVMTKSAAGLIPLFVWVFAALVKKDRELTIGRFARVCGLIVILVAPWHLYQIAVHPRWLWADYVQVQLVDFGTHPAAQSSSEPQAWFYLRRIAETDPVLLFLALLGLPPLLAQAFKRRRQDAVVLTAALVVVAGALLAFRYRNLPYALYIVPFLAIVGAGYSPTWRWRNGVLAALLAVKIVFPGYTWGSPMGASDPLPQAIAMRAYARAHRPNELIVISPEDNFYSCTLDIPHVRYAYIDPAGVVKAYAPHYAYLGISLTGEEFLHLAETRSMFRERLRAWGADSDEALGTAIALGSEEEIGGLARANPRSDFAMPESMGRKLPREVLEAREVVRTEGGWFLLSREPGDSAMRSPFAERPPEW